MSDKHPVETFSTTHAYISVSLSCGSAIEFSFDLSPNPIAENALESDQTALDSLTLLLGMLRRESAAHPEQCALSDDDDAASLRILLDAFGESGPVA